MADPMTEDEHRTLGDSLRRQHDQAVKLEVDLANRYGQHHPAVRLAEKHSRALAELRSALEDQMFKDLKGTPAYSLPNPDPQSLVNIYYGEAGRTPR